MVAFDRLTHYLNPSVSSPIEVHRETNSPLISTAVSLESVVKVCPSSYPKKHSEMEVRIRSFGSTAN